MTIPFLVANWASSFTSQNYRATAGAGYYLVGINGGVIGTVANAADTTASTCDTSTNCTISASSGIGSRTYALMVSGFGTGGIGGSPVTGFFTGTLKVYCSLSASDGANIITSQATADYSIDNGTTWITFQTVTSNLSGTAVTYGPAETDISLTNINLALLQVRLTCTGSRVGSIDSLDTQFSSGALYDAVFVTSANGAGYVAAYRPNTSTNVGTAPTNQTNAYDTSTVDIDGTSSSSAISSTVVAVTQVYSGWVGSTTKGGWLVVKAQIVVSAGTTAAWAITWDVNAAASPGNLFSTGLGGTGTVGSSSKTAVASGTYNVVLYMYISSTLLSNLRVKVSETGGTGVSCTINVYDVVFLSTN